MSFPPPSAAALDHAARVGTALSAAIERAGGWLPFSEFMDLALYAPSLGYYMAGARKLGPEGDFTTAPELSPLFGATLASVAMDVLEQPTDEILEIGAGSGALAAALLRSLEERGRLPARYRILELSPELRERSRDYLRSTMPHLFDRIVWIDRLPESFSGLVLGNEVLDAMPVTIARVTSAGIEEGGVTRAVDRNFTWAFRPATPEIVERVEALGLAPPYTTEIGLVAEAFVATLGRMLTRGVLLFIDYGFPEREFYHPQRSMGTLMCHYRHQAHADPFHLPGLEDITAHVNFSAIARAAASAGAELLGYTSQASFLIDAGITEALAAFDPADAARYLPQSNAIQRLVSPAEMGELFKAIAFGRGINRPLCGFRRGDRSARL